MAAVFVVNKYGISGKIPRSFVGKRCCLILCVYVVICNIKDDEMFVHSSKSVWWYRGPNRRTAVGQIGAFFGAV